jgi:hypothetical protein
VGTSDLGQRQYFGAGSLALNPSTSVFLNCPFDQEYSPLFDAIVFATVSCGFMPRSALESGNVAESRMDRITRAIFSSKYSIHDLSRCRGQGDANLARFNMPLELGIAMARRYHAAAPGEVHDWLVLVPEGHEYLRFISDMAGFDPKTYDGSVEGLVPRVMAWLATREDAVRTATPRQVLAALPALAGRLQNLRTEWGGEAPWGDTVLAAIEIAKSLKR